MQFSRRGLRRAKSRAQKAISLAHSVGFWLVQIRERNATDAGSRCKVEPDQPSTPCNSSRSTHLRLVGVFLDPAGFQDDGRTHLDRSAKKHIATIFAIPKRYGRKNTASCEANYHGPRALETLRLWPENDALSQNRDLNGELGFCDTCIGSSRQTRSGCNEPDCGVAALQISRAYFDGFAGKQQRTHSHPQSQSIGRSSACGSSRR